MPTPASRASLCVCVFAATAAALTGCRRDAPQAPAFPPSKVTVVRPPVYAVQSYHEYNGHLEPVETVEVKARVKGLLQEVHFAEGEEVALGAKLYTIDPREYLTAVARSTAELAKAAADINNWKAQTRLAEAEFERLSGIAGSASRSELDKAKAAVDINAAQLAVAVASQDGAAAALQTAKIQLGYTDIKAPIAGRISRTLVTKGNLVGQDAPTLLTTIVSVETLHVYFDAPERDLVEYQRSLRTAAATAQARDTTVQVGVATEEGYPHAGRIDFRENRVDAGTGTVRLRGLIPNPAAPPNNARLLYPGLYARVRVPAGEPESLPVVPEEALMTGQEGRYLYVVGAGDVVEKRTVVVGPRVWQAPPPGDAAPPGWALADPTPAAPTAADKGALPAPARLPVRAVVAIKKGIEPGDRVVVNGLQKARVGAAVAPDDWELRPPPSPAGR
jgi:multidrug efflux system membrane fusion protein